MNSLIKLKTTPRLVITVALLCFGLLPTARAPQVGDTVFDFVSVENRVPLTVSNDPQEVFHIGLDDGVWLVSGQVNFLGNISVGSLSFDPTQTAQVTAEQVARLGNIIRNTSLVPRTVDVAAGTNVYLVAGSFNPNPSVSAWGFMTAVKIRNHVD